MRTIYTQGMVNSDGRLSVPVPADVSLGEHRVIILMEDQPAQRKGVTPRGQSPGQRRISRVLRHDNA